MNAPKFSDVAVARGVTIGQISISEFILRDYGEDIPANLKLFLNKIANIGYDELGEAFNKPSEDVALSVQEIMNRALK